MANFCPTCGAKLSSPDIKFCSECGAKIAPEPFKPEELEKKPISETSRLSSLKIEKYLMPNEIATYATRGSLYVGGEADLKGYVTNNRVMFYASKGLIFKSDRLHEIPLNEIRSYKIVEEGMILKTMHLQLNDLKIKGDRSDILELYKAIQAAKYKKNE